MMTILGISAFYHDSAAAIVQDGKVVAAAQEERFTRKKHDPAFPTNAVKLSLRCLIWESFWYANKWLKLGVPQVHNLPNATY